MWSVWASLLDTLEDHFSGLEGGQVDTRRVAQAPTVRWELHCGNYGLRCHRDPSCSLCTAQHVLSIIPNPLTTIQSQVIHMQMIPSFSSIFSPSNLNEPEPALGPVRAKQLKLILRMIPPISAGISDTACPEGKELPTGIHFFMPSSFDCYRALNVGLLSKRSRMRH